MGEVEDVSEVDEAQHEAAPAPEAEEIVDAVLGEVGPGESAELAVADPADPHSVMVAMDAHDAQKLVERLTRQAQGGALKKWVYEIGRGRSLTRGLTVDAVEDVVQQMNWTGKCAIGVVKRSAVFEVIEADEGNGLEPFWCCTVEAEDRRTGSIKVGTSMEPQWMTLRPETARKYREEGKPVREDGKVFDRFSRAKALNKAQRNAEEKHIPEVVKQTILAMAAKKPELVERIQTEQEAKAAAWPAPLDTPEAKALIGELEGVYDEIRELGDGQGKVKLTPGTFAAWMMQSQHDLAALDRFKVWLLERRQQIQVELERERLDREAVSSVLLVACPRCGAKSKQRCVAGGGKPKRDCPERLPARRAQLEKA